MTELINLLTKYSSGKNLTEEDTQKLQSYANISSQHRKVVRELGNPGYIIRELRFREMIKQEFTDDLSESMLNKILEVTFN